MELPTVSAGKKKTSININAKKQYYNAHNFIMIPFSLLETVGLLDIDVVIIVVEASLIIDVSLIGELESISVGNNLHLRFWTVKFKHSS